MLGIQSAEALIIPQLSFSPMYTFLVVIGCREHPDAGSHESVESRLRRAA